MCRGYVTLENSAYVQGGLYFDHFDTWSCVKWHKVTLYCKQGHLLEENVKLVKNS